MSPRSQQSRRGGSRTAPVRSAVEDDVLPATITPRTATARPDGCPLLELTVSDVKQYVYCPRVVYFTSCRQLRRPVTYKMAEGQLEHEDVEAKEHRRSLRAYGVRDGERHFAVRLRSGRLGLAGTLDMIIVTPTEAIPVEFKNTSASPGLNHKYQLTAYALLAEEHWAKPTRRGFVYLIPEKRAVEIEVTPSMRSFVLQVLEDIRAMVLSERMPAPTRQVGRCVDCEFKNYCGDASFP